MLFRGLGDSIAFYFIACWGEKKDPGLVICFIFSSYLRICSDYFFFFLVGRNDGKMSLLCGVFFKGFSSYLQGHKSEILY